MASGAGTKKLDPLRKIDKTVELNLADEENGLNDVKELVQAVFPEWQDIQCKVSQVDNYRS